MRIPNMQRMIPKSVKRNVGGWRARINPIAATNMEFAVK
jgi:hypothetical protein